MSRSGQPARCLRFGHRLVLDLEAHDGLGSIPFLHTDPLDRDPAMLAGTNNDLLQQGTTFVSGATSHSSRGDHHDERA